MPSSSYQLSGSTQLSIVIVNYRSWPDVESLVTLLANSPAIDAGDCEILVVDNASPGPIPARLLEPNLAIRLLIQPHNHGFASGVNAGWRASRSPWILVLNPDVVPDPGLIAGVLSRVAGYDIRLEGEPGIVGFGLRNLDGSRQPSVGAFPGLLRTIWEQLIPRVRRKYQPDWKVRPGPVDWVTGACMLLNSRMLESVGGMDEEFFLYYEEVALCRSARRLGWRVEYDPGLSVVHLRPLQNRPISPKMRVITRHSKLLYFRKHLPAWQFSALANAVRLEARTREIWCQFRGKPEERRAWRTIETIATGLEAGTLEGGPAILALAEAVEDDPEEPDEPESASSIASPASGPRQRHRRSHGTRHFQP